MPIYHAILNWVFTPVSTAPADGFIIKRRGSGQVYTELARVGPDIRTYDDAAVAINQVYYWSVEAYSASGSSAVVENHVTVSAPIPPAPTSLTITVTVS